MRTLTEMEIASVSGGDLQPMTNQEMRDYQVGDVPTWLLKPYQPIPVN